MTTFDKAESDPVTKGRRMGNSCDPACTVARDLVRGTQDSAGVEDLLSVTWENADQPWPVCSDKFGPLTKCTANVGLLF